MKTIASHTTTNVPQGPSVEPKGMILRPLPAGALPCPSLGSCACVPPAPGALGTLPGLRPPQLPLISSFSRAPRPGRGGVPPTQLPGPGRPPPPGLDKEQGPAHQHLAPCTAGTRAQSRVGLPSPGEQLWSRVQEPWGLRASCGTLPGDPAAPGWFDARAEQEGVETSAGGRQDLVQRGQAGGAMGRHGE